MFFTIVKSGADLLVTAILSTSLAAMILIYFWIVSTTIISCWDRYSGLVEHNVFVQQDLQFGIGITILVPGIPLFLVTCWWLLK